ncbi:hypothetical protein RHOFW510R12_00745 [Rhodanobacter sp. FW510-R12]
MPLSRLDPERAYGGVGRLAMAPHVNLPLSQARRHQRRRIDLRTDATTRQPVLMIAKVHQRFRGRLLVSIRRVRVVTEAANEGSRDRALQGAQNGVAIIDIENGHGGPRE